MSAGSHSSVGATHQMRTLLSVLEEEPSLLVAILEYAHPHEALRLGQCNSWLQSAVAGPTTSFLWRLYHTRRWLFGSQPVTRQGPVWQSYKERHLLERHWKEGHAGQYRVQSTRPPSPLTASLFLPLPAQGVEAPAVAVLGGTVGGTLVLLTLRGDRLVTVWHSGRLDGEAEGGGGGVGEGRSVTALHATALPPLTPAQGACRLLVGAGTACGATHVRTLCLTHSAQGGWGVEDSGHVCSVRPLAGNMGTQPVRCLVLLPTRPAGGPARPSGTQGDVAVPPAWAIIVASGSKLHLSTLPHGLDPGAAQHTQEYDCEGPVLSLHPCPALLPSRAPMLPHSCVLLLTPSTCRLLLLCRDTFTLTEHGRATPSLPTVTWTTAALLPPPFPSPPLHPPAKRPGRESMFVSPPGSAWSPAGAGNVIDREGLLTWQAHAPQPAIHACLGDSHGGVWRCALRLRGYPELALQLVQSGADITALDVDLHPIHLDSLQDEDEGASMGAVTAITVWRGGVSQTEGGVLLGLCQASTLTVVRLTHGPAGRIAGAEVWAGAAEVLLRGSGTGAGSIASVALDGHKAITATAHHTSLQVWAVPPRAPDVPLPSQPLYTLLTGSATLGPPPALSNSSSFNLAQRLLATDTAVVTLGVGERLRVYDFAPPHPC